MAVETRNPTETARQGAEQGTNQGGNQGGGTGTIIRPGTDAAITPGCYSNGNLGAEHRFNDLTRMAEMVVYEPNGTTPYLRWDLAFPMDKNGRPNPKAAAPGYYANGQIIFLHLRHQQFPEGCALVFNEDGTLRACWPSPIVMKIKGAAMDTSVPPFLELLGNTAGSGYNTTPRPSVK
jgi:hypothetical protein